MGSVVAWLLVLTAVIVVSVWARRRHVKNFLLSAGTRTHGRETKVSTAPPGSSAARRALQTMTVVSFIAGDGRRRSVIPLRKRFDWGDATGTVWVIYDPRRPHVADRILCGFGSDPKRWYRVRFHGDAAGAVV